jgi:ribosomal protein L4
MFVLDSLEGCSSKTKDFTELLKKLKVYKKGSSVLLIVDKINDNVKKSTANIDFLTVQIARQTNVYEILYARKVIVTKEALELLIARINKENETTA